MITKHTGNHWHYSHSSAPDWTGDWYILSGAGNVIAMGEGWDEESQANVKLLAAAPELLTALQMAIAALKDNNIDESMAGEFEILTDAIAKATP